MKIPLILSCLMITFSGFGQTGKLNVSLSVDDSDNYESDTTYYTLHIFNQLTSVKRTMLVEWENGEISIDSLSPNDYILQINNTKSDSMMVYQCWFTIERNQQTNLSIDVSSNEHTYEIDEETHEEIVFDRMESQFELGYFDNKWVENKPLMRQSYSISSSVCYWNSFSKHLGVLMGSGFGINLSSISKDTVYFNAPQFNKRHEYYNYLYISPEFKFRFTLKNQRDDYDFLVKGLIIDIGARYHFPLAFKHVGRFSGNMKMIERGLHQYTDLRVFASIGCAPALVFFEYRPFDFMLGNYPELPKYTVGLKFVLHN